MSHSIRAFRRNTARVLGTALLITGMGALAPNAASAFVSCGTGTTDYADVNGWGEIIYTEASVSGSNYNGRDLALPATLHGRKIRLMNGRYTDKMYAKADSWSSGDIISIDWARATTTQSWRFTSQISGGWDYCEKTLGTGNVLFRDRSPVVPGRNHPVRVCLRHAGSLQCTNIWRSDHS
jgi:hypothetical protein